jgi:2Fe-2S ferredoxin
MPREREHSFMVKVTFVKADGSERIIDVPAGQSVMRSAIENDIDEILGDCGGVLSCATCHVHVASEWIERTGKASSEEQAMLEMAVDPDESDHDRRKHGRPHHQTAEKPALIAV